MGQRKNFASTLKTRFDTYFASPVKKNGGDLQKEIRIVEENPILSGLLHSVSGILAILNEQRQIIALNDSLLDMLGIDNPSQVLGLRPGEAIHCIHAKDEPAGCGTTKFCSSCGAAIAIVSSFSENIPVEKICALTAQKGSKNVDMALLVKAHPIEIEKQRFLLLFLQDITLQQQRAALERTFFHDMNNMLNILLQASELLLEDFPDELSETIYQTAIRLHKEVAIQRCLAETETSSYQPLWHEYRVEKIFTELQSLFANHPAKIGKAIEFSNFFPVTTIKTDVSALLRILSNMLINALEATAENGVVKIWSELKENSLNFHVWNDKEIPENIRGRIFQRNFSTKKQAGRGIGTYSMKLFGEKILGGQVDFTSSKEEGTIFRFSQRL